MGFRKYGVDCGPAYLYGYGNNVSGETERRVVVQYTINFLWLIEPSRCYSTISFVSLFPTIRSNKFNIYLKHHRHHHY